MKTYTEKEVVKLLADFGTHVAEQCTGKKLEIVGELMKWWKLNIPAEQELRISDVSNRYLVEYLNKGGANRQTYIEAINEDACRKEFFSFHDGTILSITDIRHL